MHRSAAAKALRGRWFASVLPWFVFLTAASTPAHTDWMNTMAGARAPGAAAVASAGRQRVWQIHEFTAIALVPKENSASENAHPAVMESSMLRRLLASVRTHVRGQDQPLFAADELEELAPPLAQALASATSAEDILLLSSWRRGALPPDGPTAVTARLFVVDGRLHIIAHDTRFEFYDAYVSAHEDPRFTFGSRSFTGNALLSCERANVKRPDWLSIPVGSGPPDAIRRVATSAR